MYMYVQTPILVIAVHECTCLCSMCWGRWHFKPSGHQRHLLPLVWHSYKMVPDVRGFKLGAEEQYHWWAEQCYTCR